MTIKSLRLHPHNSWTFSINLLLNDDSIGDDVKLNMTKHVFLYIELSNELFVWLRVCIFWWPLKICVIQIIHKALSPGPSLPLPLALSPSFPLTPAKPIICIIIVSGKYFLDQQLVLKSTLTINDDNMIYS